MVPSSAIVCDHDRRIADDRRSMFPYDRRRSQTLLRSAIRDHMETGLMNKKEMNGTKMTEIAEINEPHSTEIANPENQTEKIQYLSCPKPETIFSQ